MTDGRRWQTLGMVVMPVAVAVLAGCSASGGSSAASPASAAAASSAPAMASGFSAAQLRGALLTRVNGVAAVSPVSIGKYGSLSAAITGRPVVNAVKVSPSACAGAASAGFGSDILAGARAAAVTFRLGGNVVSEVLIATSAGSASDVFAGRVPTGCTKYQGTVAGKTVNYGLTEKTVTGIGQQARVLNVRVGGATPVNQWSLVYRGAGFVGTVTVTGPNASEVAARQLAQQAYAYAARSLA